MHRTLLVASILPLLGACATLPDDAFRLTESALEMREVQTREYDGVTDIDILSASSAVLQDLGYGIDEVEKELGVLSASKRADASDSAEMAGKIRTQSGTAGVEASIGDTLTVKITDDGGWTVERQDGVTPR